MIADQREGTRRKRLSRLGTGPRGCTRWVRQWDDIDARLAARHHLHRADLFNEWARRQELFDCDAPDGQDQMRLEQFDFALEPGATIEQLLRSGHAIAALRVFAGKAAARSSDVHARAELLFIEAEREEPLEQLFTGGPSEGSAERRLLVTWGLTNEENLGAHRGPHDRGAMHVRAEPAGAKRSLVGEDDAECGGHWGRRDCV